MDLPDWLAEPAPKKKKRESTVEKRFVDWCKDVGVVQWKLQGLGKTGYPDRTVFLGFGRICLIEFKQKGKKARPDQIRIHDDLKRLGIPVLVTDDFDEAVQWVTENLKNGSR